MESLESFYRRKFDWIPDNLKSEIGHFNIFKLKPFTGKNAKPIPYKRRDFYKVMLVIGGGRVHFADKSLQVNQRALSFSNPLIPYKWEDTEHITGGIYCIFDRHFLEDFGGVLDYPVFKSDREHLFELSEDQAKELELVFDKMLEDIQSDYAHKYDSLRNRVMELLHFAMKMQPVKQFEPKDTTASERIATMFMELLERQFPINIDHRKIGFRSASAFADQLNIHVNHLNRAVKEVTQKTTTELIGERILKESKILLKHSNWAISEIAYALDFKESTHFSNFFKSTWGPVLLLTENYEE